MGFLDKAKAAAEQAAVKAKEGVEEVQTKRELTAAYGELGHRTLELVRAGTLDRPELAELVGRIEALEAKLAEGGHETAPDGPEAQPSAAPPAMPT